MILENIANLATIVTALFATWAYAAYRYRGFVNKQKLEAYLQSEKQSQKDNGRRTLLHLMAKLGLTEAEILQASFGSKKIIRKLASDSETNRATAILFEYK